MTNEAEIEVAKEVFQGSLHHFSRWLLGYKDINRRTHGDLVSLLEDDRDRKLIVMPRGTFKSSIACVAYPLWLLSRNPNLRILIDSEVYNNSKNFVREIRGHVTSQRFMEVFGDWRSDANWNEGEITIKPRSKVLKEASVTAGGIGTTKVGQHYDVIIGDDYNSGNNSNTPEACEKVIKHYQMNTAILDPGGTYVIIGTRYSVLDVIGFVLQNEMGLDPTGTALAV